MKFLFVKLHNTGQRMVVPVDKILYFNEYSNPNSEYLKSCNTVITLTGHTSEYNPGHGPEPIQLYVSDTIDTIVASLRVMYEPQ